MARRNFHIACCLLVAGCHAEIGKKSAEATPARNAEPASSSGEGEGVPPPVDQCPPDPIFGGTKMDTVKVAFPDTQGEPSVVAELATSDNERERGLMYRTHLPKNAGMLFLPDGPPHVQTFWMKNTCIPLDMLFIDEEGKIVGILENVPPMNLKPRSVHAPSSYVLEVNAGWCKRNGVTTGSKVRLPNLKGAGER